MVDVQKKDWEDFKKGIEAAIVNSKISLQHYELMHELAVKKISEFPDEKKEDADEIKQIVEEALNG